MNKKLFDNPPHHMIYALRGMSEDSLKRNLAICEEKDLASTKTYQMMKDTYDEICYANKLKQRRQEQIRHRNEPIKLLLKWYSNKKSRKVVEARKKLQERFLHLEYKEQLTIIREMMKSGKTDRLWCYNIFRKWWTDEMSSDILHLWELYHEERCGWIITSYFPVEVLQQYEKSLSYDSNYYYLCKRVASESWFKVDKERLRKIIDDDSKYLWIMSQTKGGLGANEAVSIVYRWIAIAIHYCDNITDPDDSHFSDGRDSSFIVNFDLWNDIRENFSMLRLRNVGNMLSSLCRMDWDSDVYCVVDLDDTVKSKFIEEHESDLQRIVQLDIKEREVEIKRLYAQFCRLYSSEIPPEYQDVLYYWKYAPEGSTENKGKMQISESHHIPSGIYVGASDEDLLEDYLPLRKPEDDVPY